MAISPNTTFVAGNVLTATQMNALPWGIVALTSNTTITASVTTEAVQITGSSFTAVANRYYKITYFEADPNSGTGYFTFRIRLTNLSGTVLNSAITTAGASTERTGLCFYFGTLTAGTTNVVATAQMSAGTGVISRSATQIGYLLVEDMGPA
jgi:hypothetical protein